DGAAVDGIRELLREEYGDAAEVPALLALREPHTRDDVLDGRGVDAGVALEQPVDHERGHVVGADADQRALEGAPDRGANGVDDDCFWHEISFLGSDV